MEEIFILNSQQVQWALISTNILYAQGKYCVLYLLFIVAEGKVNVYHIDVKQKGTYNHFHLCHCDDDVYESTFLKVAGSGVTKMYLVQLPMLYMIDTWYASQSK